MAKKTGLGRGLDSLISTSYKEEEVKPKELSTKTVKKVDKPVENDENAVVTLRISMIDPNKNQPRKAFKEESLKELADSITTYGMIQPIVVTKSGKRYQIVAGERRFRAAKLAGLKEIPVIIREFTEAERTEVAIIENIQRDDLNPIEKAQAYDQLIKEYSLTQEELAKRLSVSRSVIANGMRLLKLSQEVQALLIEEKITEGHARLLITLEPEQQNEIAAIIVKNDLSVRDTERLVASLAEASKKTKRTRRTKSADLTQLEDELQAMVNTKVAIKCSSAEAGKLLIDYYSLEELDRIIEILRKGSNG